MKKLYITVMVAFLATLASTVYSADDESAVEEVVVTGSQIKGAKITGALPVSVITGLDIEAIAADSGDDLLESIAEQGQNYFTEAEDASGGVNASRGDVGAYNLRNLGVGNSLTLLNGRRLVNSPGYQTELIGGDYVPTVSVNSNLIPVSGIERLEILRDGASAQYGSDAIADVINIVLKSSTDEFSGSINAGMRNAKAPSEYDVLREESFDGQSFQINGNYGVKVGKDGFINVTADYLTKAHTNRAADPAKWDIYREQFGDAAAESFGTYFNARVPLFNENTHFYILKKTFF